MKIRYFRRKKNTKITYAMDYGQIIRENQTKLRNICDEFDRKLIDYNIICKYRNMPEKTFDFIVKAITKI